MIVTQQINTIVPASPQGIEWAKSLVNMLKEKGRYISASIDTSVIIVKSENYFLVDDKL